MLPFIHLLGCSTLTLIWHISQKKKKKNDSFDIKRKKLNRQHLWKPVVTIDVYTHTHNDQNEGVDDQTDKGFGGILLWQQRLT